ncbi:MAG: response regulator [Clostridia bacterium]|nr:response regulator [Clostridia bacterium]
MLLSRQENMRIAALSHDLRTPVTSVVALTQLALEAQRQGKEVECCLGELLIAAHALESIASDLAVSGEEDEFSGEELERELLVLATRRAGEKGQRLTVDMGALKGMHVAADRSALERILMNLLTNAIKYTQEGGEISLRASVRQHGENGASVTFVVRDNGMGMKRDFLRKLYRPYARAKEAILCRIPGTGMGLAIVRRLVERMHGTIQVSSEWGEGTVFTVCVPMRLVCPAACEAAAEREDDRACLAGRKLLVAEDNALCARIALQILTGAKAEVEIAVDGADAVRHFAQGHYDAVVMDMRMPGMDGCAAAEAIRKEERGHVPIIAMTAGQEAQDKEAALRAGMDDCLIKPLEVGRLAKALKVCWNA